jgi:hypothetical protein
MNFFLNHRWIPILGDTGGIFRRGLVANAYCRGDEQLIAHCQWHQPMYNMCNEFLALECDGWFCSKYSKYFDFLRSVIFH